VGPALAQKPAGQHPYHGLFSDETGRSTPRDLAANHCFLKFFDQTPDGRFTAFQLDLGLFRRTGEVRYRRTDRGQCRYDQPTGREDCTIDALGGEKIENFTVVEKVDAEGVDLLIWFDREKRDAVELDETFPVRFWRCPFERSLVQSRIVDETGTSAERDELGEAGQGNEELVTAVRRALGQ
jgi:hypothetical protein